MGAKGNLIVPGVTIVQAVPWQQNTTGYADQIWKYRRKLKLSAEVPRAIARAHAELTQDICCVVREKPRGPRGGRGAMHYNGEPRFGEWWPAAWNHAHKGYRFYLVAEVVEPSHYEQVQRDAVAGLAQAYGASPAKAQIQMMVQEYRSTHPAIASKWEKLGEVTTSVIDESSEFIS